MPVKYASPSALRITFLMQPAHPQHRSMYARRRTSSLVLAAALSSTTAVSTPSCSAASVSHTNSSMEVVCVPCLSDNYVWLLHEAGSGKTAVVDPAEAGPVQAVLRAR